MKQSTGRILYRLIIAIYLLLSMCGFIFPIGISITYSNKGDIGNIIKVLVIGFVPYIIVGFILIAITSLLKLRRVSLLGRKIAIVGSIFCMLMIILCIATLLYVTTLHWQRTYPHMGNTTDMDGGIEWIAAWIGGSCSGLLILFLGYLRISQPLVSDALTS